MTRLRLALLLSPALLLAACGDAQGHGESRNGSSAPLGFELAAAATSDDAAASTAAAPMIDLTPEQLAERIKAGKVRAIGVASAQRLKTLPQTPTLIEQGVAGFEAFAWQGLVAPPG